MSIDITMPEIGEGVTEATVVAWLKNVGEPIEAGEVIVEIMTDKASLEIESPAAGVLGEILHGADEEVRIGTVLGRINATGGRVMNRSNETMLELYRLMVVTREIDVAVAEIDGHWHGCDGEEAEVAAAYHGLKEGDLVAPHYCGSLSAAYARGADLRRLFAGIMGKATSYNRGRYRSDVCGPPEFNIIGLYSGALGLPLSYATGAALAFKLDGTDNVAVAVFGDGTSSRGDCHEAMNMASALKLPVVFVCQNNQVAISTPSGDTVAGNSVADRALGYGMPGARVDGNDVIAMHDAMEAAKARARRGEGPSLIEGLTYRAAGHFVSDAADPRPRNEVEAWRGRNPIRLVRERLGADGVADAARLDAIDAEVTAEVTAAMEQARNDPNPDAEVLDVDKVYA